MEEPDQPRKTKPAGNQPPPRPPHRTAVGLGPGGDDSGKKHRATITQAAEGEGKFIRKAHFGHIIIKVEPNGRGMGNQIVNDIPDGMIPLKYLEVVMGGLRADFEFGLPIQLPDFGSCVMVDVIVHLVGGSYHEIDSSEVAFVGAGHFAIKNAIIKAGPIALE